MNENEFYLAKEYNFDNPIIQKIDALIDNSIKVVIVNIFIPLIIYVNMI